MTIRGLRLRAILLPLGVALLSIAALGWYGLVRIPAQERYLNERNLRILRTRSAQLKAKVDNFDRAIDHALESYHADNARGDQLRDSLGEYVRLFSRGDLEVRQADKAPATADSTNIEDVLMRFAADPPVVRIQRDEGKNYLYIGSRPRDGDERSVSKVVVRNNIEMLATSYLEVGSEFDGLLLADSSGRVIAQSAAAVNLARVDTLIDAPRPDQRASGEQHRPTFASLRMSSNVANVTVGDAGYKLYVQPVQLSLIALRTDQQTGKTIAGDPEEWVLCGLVRADHFRAEAAAISYTYLLWFSTALAALCLGIPLVKLRVLSPRERVTANDGVWVSVTTFAAAGLLTLIGMDVYAFRYDFRRAVDERLQRVAQKLRANLSDELTQIDRQLAELQDAGASAMARVDDAVKGRTDKTPKIVVKPHDEVDDDAQHTKCRPEPACDSRLLEKPTEGGVIPQTYQYFDIAAWNDVKGSQRVKWSTTATVTPFLNIKDERLPHYQALERAWRLAGSPLPAPTNGISLFMSPSTGERVTVFWRAILAETYSANVGQSLSMSSPIALDRPLLPNNVRFAVIDSEGRVMYHADGARSLQESFFKECEDDPGLRSAVRGRRNASLTAYYLGRPMRMYVTPLFGTIPFSDPRWSLVVFQDNAVLDTLNLETLTLALVMFAAFGAVLAAGTALLHFHAPGGRRTKWFWPEERKAGAYVAAALVNAIAIVLFVIAASLLPAAPLLGTAAARTGSAAIATYLIITRSEPSSHRTIGWREFFWARAAFLFVIAGIPAVACFQAAYDFEMRLLVRSDQVHKKDDTKTRERRIRTRVVERLALSSPPQIDAFVRGRLNRTWDDHWMPLFASTERNNGRGERALAALMTAVHRSYNDIAVDLETAAGSVDAISIQSRAVPAQRLAAIAAMLVCGFYVLLRWLVQPLFALDATSAAAVKALGVSSDLAARVIVVGPPGSGKTTRLAKDRRIRIFDIRTLSYLERRKRVRPAIVERRASATVFRRVVGSIGGVDWEGPDGAPPVDDHSGDARWADAFDYSTLPADEDAVVGIDHLDHRLDEPEFRKQTLKFLEELIYRRNRKVSIASDRDPLACIADWPLSDPHLATTELDRWTRVLQSFRKESASVADELAPDRIEAITMLARTRLGADSPAARVVLEECASSPQLMRIAEDLFTWMNRADAWTDDDARREFGAAAEPYYQAVWQSCAIDQRLALRQLAEEGLVNPRNQDVVRQLIRSGLVRRDPTLRVMNETFRRFILRAATGDQVAGWERAGVQVPWASIEAAMVTLVVGLAGLLIVTQEQLLGAWIGFVPTLAPAVPTMWKLFAERAVKGEGPLSAAVRV